MAYKHEQNRNMFGDFLRSRRSRSVHRRMFSGSRLLLAVALVCGATGALAEAPKRGGVLTYMIPADGGPSLDGHRETTYAVVHATAPFYSVLIRVDPDNPVLDQRFQVRLVHRDAEANGQWADLYLQDPQGREVSRRLAR